LLGKPNSVRENSLLNHLAPSAQIAQNTRVADPALLQPLVARLQAAASARGMPRVANLADALGQVLAIDGSFFTVAADVAWAVAHRTNRGQMRGSVRLDMHPVAPLPVVL
jgi:uncharacterized protein (DUF3084 family)